MAALTEDAQRLFQPGIDEAIGVFPVAAGAVIYQHAAVAVIKSSGYLRPATGDTTTEDFAGFAERKADNTGGAAGAITCRVKTKGMVTLDALAGSPSIATHGDVVYASTDNDFSLSDSGNDLPAGRQHQFDSASAVRVQYKGISHGVV